ncbi:14810_t:CDS:1, partial [Cetraspora pellucida]
KNQKQFLDYIDLDSQGEEKQPDYDDDEKDTKLGEEESQPKKRKRN